MSQAHDQGVKKRKLGRKPDRARTLWNRVKRRHPGPLPFHLADFGEWVKRGRPKR